MKSGLAWGSFLCIICLYRALPGGGDGGYLPDGAGAAGVGQGRGPPIRSSSGGQDKVIDTPMTLAGALV